MPLVCVLLALALRSELAVGDAFAGGVDPEEIEFEIEFIDEVDPGGNSGAVAWPDFDGGCGRPLRSCLGQTERGEVGGGLPDTGPRVDENEFVGVGAGLDAIPEGGLVREPGGSELIPKHGILAVRG